MIPESARKSLALLLIADLRKPAFVLKSNVLVYHIDKSNLLYTGYRLYAIYESKLLGLCISC